MKKSVIWDSVKKGMLFQRDDCRRRGSDPQQICKGGVKKKCPPELKLTFLIHPRLAALHHIFFSVSPSPSLQKKREVVEIKKKKAQVRAKPRVLASLIKRESGQGPRNERSHLRDHATSNHSVV